MQQFPSLFKKPIIHPGTSVYIKANTIGSIKRDIVGKLIPESEVPQDVFDLSNKYNVLTNNSVTIKVVYIKCKDNSMVCIPEHQFQLHVNNGNIRVFV